MSAVRVVVVFASRRGATERLAMAAAVGAVEEHADIRLRRLPESDRDLPADSVWLAREYVPPRDADAAWADALIFLAPDWLEPSSPDLQRYFASLAALRQAGRWRIRACAVIAAGPARDFIERQMAALGIATVPVPDADSGAEQARRAGHAVAVSSVAASS